MIHGGLRTDTFDIAQGPIHDANFNERAPYCCNDLRPEKCSWRNLHVMTQFEVCHEGHALGHLAVSHSDVLLGTHGDVAVYFEQHHAQGSPWLHITNNEFCDDVQAELLICDCNYKSDG